MAAVGGSIESLTLSGRTFPVAGDAEANRKVGGWENDIQMNGDGVSARLIKTRMGWSLAGVAVSVDDTLGDQEFLQNLADSNDFFAVGISYGDGRVWQGRGQIMGEIVHSSANATSSLELRGPGQLTQQ